MDLLSPGSGLIIWQTLLLLYVGGFIWALVDILRSDFKDSVQKLVWIVVILFLPIIGTVLYFTIGRRQRVNA